MNKGLSLSGIEGMKKSIHNMKDATFEHAMQALNDEHEDIMTEAKGLTPVLTGALRSSGHVVPPEIQGNNIVSIAGFGGAAAPYAVYVHERFDLFHKAPTTWKYYERPFLDHLDGMNGRLARAIESKMSRS